MPLEDMCAKSMDFAFHLLIINLMYENYVDVI